MTERYPAAWRDACLDLLKVRRAELHNSLGYKRMSWNPIRNEIMRPFEQPDKYGVVQPDERLIRQNFDSWEKGKVLNDEKFAFIDRYIRGLAMTGNDLRARRILREQRFQERTRVLKSIYVEDIPNKRIAQATNGFHFVIVSEEVTDSWFKSIIIRSMSSHNGIIEVVAAYLPVIYSELNDENVKDIVFFDGFLIPLEIIKAEGFMAQGEDTIISSIKLVRPEYRGLSGRGYAEAELRMTGILEPDGFENVSFSLRFANPVACPSISPKWEEKAYKQQEVGIILRGGFPDPNKFLKGPQNRLGFTQIAGSTSYHTFTSLDIIDNIFRLVYKGYI